MKRSYFFFLDKLKITAVERRVMIVLIGTLTLLAILNLFWPDGQPAVDTEHYAALQEEFQKRSTAIKTSRNKKLERYYPALPMAEETGRNAPLSTENSSQQMGSEPEEKSNASTDSRQAADDKQPESIKININTATLQQLEMLPGIGPVYAKRIIEYRKTSGKFRTPAELKNIKGIGAKRLEKLRPMLDMSAFNDN